MRKIGTQLSSACREIRSVTLIRQNPRNGWIPIPGGETCALFASATKSRRAGYLVPFPGPLAVYGGGTLSGCRGSGDPSLEEHCHAGSQKLARTACTFSREEDRVHRGDRLNRRKIEFPVTNPAGLPIQFFSISFSCGCLRKSFQRSMSYQRQGGWILAVFWMGRRVYASRGRPPRAKTARVPLLSTPI